MEKRNSWPELNFPEIKDTLATLHQWIQIVGKIRLTAMPWQNQSWHCTLYVTPTGFSTHPIPYQGQTFQIDFDFTRHQLVIQSSAAEDQTMELQPKTVADFYDELFAKLTQMGIDIEIHSAPNEMEPAIPFRENTVNKSYVPKAAQNIWLAMLKANEVFQQFRSNFIGKCSPVHLFWGAFDLAVTRFSGNPAPPHPGGMPNIPLEIMQEAYSQEVSSSGFWPGSEDFPLAIFYSYVYPVADNFATQKVKPEQAFYSEEMGEFMLKYDDVRNAENPEKVLHAFLQSTYEAAANTSNWDREKLEKQT